VVLPFNSFNKGAWSWDQEKFLDRHQKKDLEHGIMAFVYGMTPNQLFESEDWMKHYAYNKRIALAFWEHYKRGMH
jgi:hypothetical protein